VRATVLNAPGAVSLVDVPDPRIHHDTDVVVAVRATCICGSDLHPYRGTVPAIPGRRIGHEFVGIVAEAGAAVRSVRVGDFVIAPFAISDGSCAHCRRGLHTSCDRGSFWGAEDRTGVLADGGQGEFVRVPLADGTLVRMDEHPDDALVPDLLALSDVMGTGHHAAVSGGVRAGDTVVVCGDGAVGLCAVAAARLLGAERIVAMSRRRERQDLARAFGATDVVAERGPDGVEAVRELLGSVGADVALECVGSQDSLDLAVDVVRPGGRVGCVGAPLARLPLASIFGRNIAVAGGVAPVRAYLPELLDAVLAGILHPGRVFDLVLSLDEVVEGYRAMDERRAVKTMLLPRRT
jgi:hypothetical protein